MDKFQKSAGGSNGREKPIFLHTSQSGKEKQDPGKKPRPLSQVLVDGNFRPFGIDRKAAPVHKQPEPLPQDEAHDEHRILFPIREENDIVKGGTETWKLCIQYGFTTLEAMQIRTAFSELARNILKYAREGEVIFKRLNPEGIRLTFIDRGPGISDIEQAMQYGFSSSGSLGLGLPGSKKLADRFEVLSSPGKGTQITFEKIPRTKAPRRTEAILRQSLLRDRAAGRGGNSAGKP